MGYTQDQFKQAPIKDNAHYMTLSNPQFEGQTRADEQGNYTMYFSQDGELFAYKKNLFN